MVRPRDVPHLQFLKAEPPKLADAVAQSEKVWDAADAQILWGRERQRTVAFALKVKNSPVRTLMAVAPTTLLPCWPPSFKREVAIVLS